MLSQTRKRFYPHCKLRYIAASFYIVKGEDACCNLGVLKTKTQTKQYSFATVVLLVKAVKQSIKLDNFVTKVSYTGALIIREG